MLEGGNVMLQKTLWFVLHFALLSLTDRGGKKNGI